MELHAYNPSTGLEAERPRDQEQPSIHETLSQKEVQIKIKTDGTSSVNSTKHTKNLYNPPETLKR